jgi:hypothetical protein
MSKQDIFPLCFSLYSLFVFWVRLAARGTAWKQYSTDVHPRLYDLAPLVHLFFNISFAPCTDYEHNILNLPPCVLKILKVSSSVAHKNNFDMAGSGLTDALMCCIPRPWTRIIETYGNNYRRIATGVEGVGLSR